VRGVSGKFIEAVMHPVVFIIAYVDQAIIASPAIAMNDTFKQLPFPE
jgi:hypothetical protein